MSKNDNADNVPTSDEGAKTEAELRQIAAARQQFFVVIMNMSWQLAVVFLLPVVGGYYLDQHFNSSPLWTVVGFVIAVPASVLVVLRQARLVTPKPEKPGGKGGSK